MVNIFIYWCNELNAIDDDSKAYIASGNFNYVPKQDKVDYDLTTYSNLLKNTSFGINSQLDTGKGLNWTIYYKYYIYYI